MLAWFTFFHPFTFNIPYHDVWGECFLRIASSWVRSLICSANLRLLIGVFRPCIFKVIIDVVKIMSNLSTYLSIIYLICLLFVLSVFNLFFLTFCQLLEYSLDSFWCVYSGFQYMSLDSYFSSLSRHDIIYT